LRSADGGDTWSPPARTPLANPSAPARLERIPGTDALVVLRNLDVDPASGWHGGPRVRLASQVSRDDGRSWSAPRVLECTGDGAWYDYPAAFWTGDVLHVAYRASGREAGRGVVDVRYLRLAKAWLLEGEGDGPGR